MRDLISFLRRYTDDQEDKTKQKAVKEAFVNKVSHLHWERISRYQEKMVTATCPGLALIILPVPEGV